MQVEEIEDIRSRADMDALLARLAEHWRDCLIAHGGGDDLGAFREVAEALQAAAEDARREAQEYAEFEAKYAGESVESSEV